MAESDATLFLNLGRVSGGTRARVDFAKKQGKPCLVVQLEKRTEVGEAAACGKGGP